MLMSEALVIKALKGLKTQTRRPIDMNNVRFIGQVFVKEWQAWQRGSYPASEFGTKSLNIEEIYLDNRLKWAVGREYALQYGRGLPTRWWQPKTKRLLEYADYDNFWNTAVDEWLPLRIRVLRLRFEDVRDISLADAIAEGFNSQSEFWKVWTGFYDKPMARLVIRDSQLGDALLSRPSNLYQAVVIDFEVVR